MEQEIRQKDHPQILLFNLKNIKAYNVWKDP